MGQRAPHRVLARLALLLGLGLLLAACAGPAPTGQEPQPTPTQAVQNAPTATQAVAVAALRTGRSYTPGPPLNPPVHIKAIDGGIVANIPLYAGLDRGYFAAEGLDVELVGLQDVATSAQAIATNQVQFYIAVPDPVIFNALNRGVDIRILVSSTTNKPDDEPAAFMVRSQLIDSGQVKTLADLLGRPVAVTNPSSQFYIARVALARPATPSSASALRSRMASTSAGGRPDSWT